MFEADLAVTTARLQQESAEATLQTMMIGPRPEAVAEAESKITVAEGAVAFSKAHLDLPHHPLAHRRRARQPHLPSRPDDRDRHSDRRGGRYAAGPRLRLPSRAIGAADPRRAEAAQVRTVESRPESAAGARGRETRDRKGKVQFVGRIADAQTGNLPVLILVDNPAGRLTLGQTMGVTITVDERAGVLQVPAAAILDLGEGPILSVVRDGKAVVLHPEVGNAARGLGGRRGDRPQGGRAGDRRGGI